MKIVKALVVRVRDNKTLTALIEQQRKHQPYKKYINYKRTLQVHSSRGIYRVGEYIYIFSCRPYSKTKTWIVFDPLIHSNQRTNKPS